MIANYYQYNDKLSAGGQPSAEQIEVLKRKGYNVIVNISPVSTKNYLQNEAEIVEQHGMDYIHFPIDCSILKESQYITFRNILKSLETNKIFVHCGGNIKSSNLIHMYQVLENGVNEDDSLQELKKIQQPEEKWVTYFKKMGMQGLN